MRVSCLVREQLQKPAATSARTGWICQPRWLPPALLAVLSASAVPALAQQIGPGAVGAQTVTGSATVVGSTTVTSGGAAITINGGTLTIDPTQVSPGAVTVQSTGNVAIRLNSGSATLSPGTQSIQVSGPGNFPSIWAQNGALTINARTDGTAGTSVTAAGVGRGLYATTGGTITASGLVLNAYYGAIADSGGTISIGPASTITLNSNTTGLAFGAIGAGTRVAVTDPAVPITLNGAQSVGAYMLNGGQVQLPAAAAITFNGAASNGIIVDNTTAAAGTIGAGLSLNFNAAPSGTSSVGLVALNGGNLSIDSVHIGASGATSNAGIGAWARAGSTITLTGASTIAITDGQGSPNFRILPATATQFFGVGPGGGITTILSLAGNATAASNPAGLFADSGTINSTGTTITVNDTGGTLSYGMNALSGGTINFDRNTVRVSGAGSAGLVTQSNAAAGDSVIIGRNSTVSASDSVAALWFMSFGSGGAKSQQISLTNTTVTATGDTIGVAATGDINARNVLSVSGGSLSSAQTTAILAFTNLAASFTNGAVARGADFLVDVAGALPAVVTLSADNSQLFGDGRTTAAATLNLALQNGSAWTGAALPITSITVDANSAWTVTASSTVTQQTANAGLIAFTPPAGGMFKTLTTGSYLGTGGTLGLNTFLGTDGSPSDVLVINAGAASGNSLLRITNAGGAGALTTGNGILVVDTINGGTTVPGTFRLAGPVIAGPYEYTLFRSSVDAANAQAWYLRSRIDCSAAPGVGPCPPVPPPEPPVPPEPPKPPVPPVPPPPEPPAPDPPNYRREVSLYTALPSMALQYGRTLLDTLHERVGEEEQLRGRADLASRDTINGAWARLIGVSGQQDRGSIYRRGPEYDYNIYAAQIGMDIYRKEDEDGHRDQAGLYLAFGRMEGDVWHFDRTRAGRDRLNAYTLGLYWTHFGPSGWYLDGILQGTFYDAKARSTDGLGLKTNGFGFAASVEGGYPFQLDDGWVIEPQGQLIYQHASLGRSGDAAAMVRFDDAESLTGRLSARVAKTWPVAKPEGEPPRKMTAWGRVSLWHEFLGDTKTRFSSAEGYVPFRSDLGATWVEFNIGVTGQFSRTGTLYGSVGYAVALTGNSYAFNGKMGIRFHW